MRIGSYNFGTMEIEGVEYRGDLIVFPDRVRTNWVRKSGHRLDMEDLGEVLSCCPEVLVIGTGALGKMEVPDPVLQSLRAKGVEVIIQQTGRAWDIFNDLAKKGRKIVGVFHLTC